MVSFGAYFICTWAEHVFSFLWGKERRIFYKCQLGEVVFAAVCVCLILDDSHPHPLLTLLIPERVVLMSPAGILERSFSSLSTISFCFIYLTGLLLSSFTLKIGMLSW